jgi:hypothetical protein
MPGTSYRSRMRWAIVFACVGTLAIGLLGGRLVRMVEPGQDFWLVFPLLLLVAAALMLAPMPWWNRLDDVQKQGQLNSWYWGSLPGGLAVLMWIVAATGPDSPASKGAVAMFIGQAAGFMVAFAVWWWRGRGPKE